MSKKFFYKLLILLFVVVCFVIFWRHGGSNYFSLTYIKATQAQLSVFTKAHPIIMYSGFFALYVLVAAISLPGGAVALTLMAGALFGIVTGTIIVSFASTIGATLAFSIARFLFGNSLQKKYQHKLTTINQGIQREGMLYLFALRLVPLFPFFLINILMGLTKFPARKFYIVSQIGMLPGTIVYVYAGTALSQLNSAKSILSTDILLAFCLLALLPFVAKKIMTYLRNRKIYKQFKRPRKYDYNLVVIGAGAAGLVASYIASAVKAKVALIEKHKMGGDCLNYGCVPSKAIIKASRIVNDAQQCKRYGFDAVDVKFDFAKIMQRVHQVIKNIAPHDSVERYKKLGVNCFLGEAKIVDPFTVLVNGKTLTTKNIIIAAGAKPFIPPIPGIDKINYVTSDTIWNLTKLPKTLLVLGGGPIGLELAQAFARLGSKVIQVEMQPNILIREDKEVQNHITKAFAKENIDLLTDHKAVEFKKRGKRQFLICAHKNKSIEIEFEVALIAIGRKARTEGYGLQDIGIEISKFGTIQADKFLRTTYPNIYVCGDITGPYQFTHYAAHQAWYAAVNALFSPFKKFKLDNSLVPWCIFTDPEIARVGLNENEAKANNLNYDITKYDIADLDRAIIDGVNTGFIKVITKKDSDKVLGVTVVGKHAGELIAEFVLAMKHNIGLNKILSTIHIYPTLTESNKYVAGVWKQKTASRRMLRILKIFHTWMRN